MTFHQHAVCLAGVKLALSFTAVSFLPLLSSALKHKTTNCFLPLPPRPHKTHCLTQNNDLTQLPRFGREPVRGQPRPSPETQSLLRTRLDRADRRTALDRQDRTMKHVRAGLGYRMSWAGISVNGGHVGPANTRGELVIRLR